MNINSLITYCKQNCIEFSENENMSKHTTFKIGGNADIFITVKNEEELVGVLDFCKRENIPYFIIGNGSNLLVSDNGINGAVISLKEMKKLALLSEEEIFCEAGVPLTALCMFAYNNSLSGLEFAYGIPGSVGGAVYMNAGAYGGEIKDVIVSANAVNSDITVYNKDDLKLSYRDSAFKHNKAIITSCTFKLKKENKDRIKQKMDENMQKRTQKQPLEYPSAGSAFKRPEGYYAAALIDKNGLRGTSVGGAKVSEKHAGFIINTGNATAKDVKKLMEKITDTVYKSDKVMLCPEVIFIGR